MPATPNYPLADVLVVIHLAFVAFVVIGLLLILAGGVCRWGWVRNFWFRLIHLAAIAVVAAEGLAGVECPLTTWERQLRWDDLHDVEGSVWVARVSNKVLYYPVGEEELAWFVRGYVAFGVLVLATFFLVPPRAPWRRRAARPPAHLPAAPPILARNGALASNGEPARYGPQPPRATTAGG